MGDFNGSEIAVIGLAGRFPGASTVEELWRNLRLGVESISFFNDEELLAAGADPADLRRPGFVRARGTLAGVDLFDAAFFDIPPREAEALDPQHRLFLECAWEALESAGYDPQRCAGAVGVFGGVTRSSYLSHHLERAPRFLAAAGELTVLFGNDKDFLSSRVAYKLGLTGPGVAVQTACSTSLVAIHMACQSLLAGECDMALAGGASVQLPQAAGYLYQEGGILSPDGHCRAFDAGAAGTVGGAGVGVVVLKPLEQALEDGDFIHAVVKGSAINNDGSARVGFSAPGVDGQVRVVEAALGVAEVEPATLQYLEAHGTGTSLGDRIELAALKRVFRDVPEGACALGSVKTNIGHLDAAAGVAGLIKVVLALRHREIPPSLHFTAPNPELIGSPFRVNDRLAPWPDGPGPRRAGVSSFGIGGTNAHAILEEAPETEPGSDSSPWQLLLLSARTPAALERASARLADALEADPEIGLADAAFTLRVGRRAFGHRRALVCRDRQEAIEALRLVAPERVQDGVAAGRPPVAFLFPGQGAQYPGMGRELYETEPRFRKEVDEACEVLRPHLGLDLRGVLYPESDPGEASRIHGTALTQPALFVVEHALAKLYLSWGIEPRALLGHSVGEYVAACLAGVLTREEALALVAARGRLIQSMPPGAMLAVRLDPAELELEGGVSLAAVNGPGRSVISGPVEAVDALEERLRARGVGVRRLRTSHAFHSAMLDPILDAFAAEVRRVRLSPPRIPWLSNVTGAWIRPEEATDPGYWVRHLRSTVRFADGLAELRREPDTVFLEVGPGGGLAGRGTVASLPKAHEKRAGEATWLEALGRLWLAGVEPDWSAFQGGERRRRVPLPTYPFERKRYWVEGVEPQPEAAVRRSAPGDRFYAPSWRRTVRPPSIEPRGAWVVLGDGGGLAEAVRRRLREAGRPVLSSIEELPAGEERRIVDLRGSFFDLLALVQALAERSALLPATVIAATSGAWDVTGSEELRPAGALVAAPARSIPLDLAGCDLRSVDLDLAGGLDEAARQLVSEAEAADRVVAWRNGRRWLPDFEPVKLPPPATLRERGVYLITGGLGGIGLTLARHLARSVRARLVLTGRSARQDDPAVRELESLGAEVLVVKADAADRHAMREAIEATGGLHGVIHAAGVPGGGLAQVRSREEAARVLAPKVEGTQVLGELLRGAGLDFLVLCSSLNALAGGVGQADYAAANAYLDAWAQAVSRLPEGERPARKVISINWDAWQEVGMAARVRAPGDWGLAPEEGVEAFLRALESGLPQVAVSTREIHAVLEDAASVPSVEPEATPQNRPPGRPYVAPRDETERAVAAVWEDVFGIRPIGIHDRFAELGGHSLLATQIQSRLRERLGADLSLAAVLECATVAELAARAAGTGRVAEDRIPRRAAGSDRAPASFSQLRLWLLDRLESGSGAYNICAALRIEGPLDPGVLARCLEEVVRRHESQRTVFALEGAEPVQVILPPRPLPLPLVDLQALPAEARGREVERLSREETARGFDLTRWPLLRTTLLRTGEREHALLLVVHHIVSDGWSVGVMFRELARLYQGSPLPELPVQYPDFAIWQRERLQGERMEALLAYWRQELAGMNQVLELPTDRRRPSIMTFHGAYARVAIPDPLLERLRAREGSGRTLFMLLLTALDTLLFRWSGQDDFGVGTFIANRTQPEIEDLLGFFVNTLVLRAKLGDLGDDPSFEELLEQVKRATTGAYAHQDLPFERLLETLQPKRDPSRTPLFQVMLVLQNTPQPVLRFGDLAMSWLPLDVRRSNFDLTFWVQPEGDGLMLDVEYGTDLFEAATVERMQGHLLNLLHALAEDPAAPLRHAALLGEAERRQLLADWNATEAAFDEAPVSRRFEQQARRSPEAAALVAGETVLSYAELDRRSTSLARALRRKGVGPETVVGIQLRRSPEMIVALLAVLKAGGAYLPLDPDYPRERLDLMIQDAGVDLVLAGSETGEEGNADLPAPEPASPAYVIFTSGSTGRPKGVVVTHRSLSNHTASAVAGYEIRAGDRVLQFASLSFDTSAEEIWPCLAAGATLVLRDERMLTSAGQFFESVGRLGITVLDLPTAFWHETAAGMEREGVPLPPSVRLVILGGERALPERLAAWHRATGARVRLVNSYGPTEGTVVTTRGDLVPEGLSPSGEPPIGRPIHNARVHVVDRAFEPVPVGVPGELLIGGAGVARGYLGRPGQTAERFVPDPFGPDPGGRLYRTGDLVRWLASGELEFLGRVDHQVKIRGFRVEVGEVEAALRALPGVRDAVVDARPDPSGTHRLVGYLVPENGNLPGDLRALLKERLPDYMVPSAFVPLPELPKTPSNKIDRKALPDPEPPRPEATYAEPQSELERVISGIWQEVLGVGRVGAHDNFFDLGGHSLLMVQAHGRLREALGRDLDILLLFQRPTVSALARELSQKPSERPAFAQARELARQQRQVNTGRKQLMEQMMKQRKGRS